MPVDFTDETESEWLHHYFVQEFFGRILDDVLDEKCECEVDALKTKHSSMRSWENCSEEYKQGLCEYYEIHMSKCAYTLEVRTNGIWLEVFDNDWFGFVPISIDTKKDVKESAREIRRIGKYHNNRIY